MCGLVLNTSGSTTRPGAGRRAGSARYAAKRPPSDAVCVISWPMNSPPLASYDSRPKANNRDPLRDISPAARDAPLSTACDRLGADQEIGDQRHAHRALHGSRRAGARQPLLPCRQGRRLHLSLGHGRDEGGWNHTAGHRRSVRDRPEIDRYMPAPRWRKPNQVIKVLVFMTDVTERASINPTRQRYFGEHKPASTLVEVKALVDPRMKVEIEAVAYVGV